MFYVKEKANRLLYQTTDGSKRSDENIYKIFIQATAAKLIMKLPPQLSAVHG